MSDPGQDEESSAILRSVMRVGWHEITVLVINTRLRTARIPMAYHQDMGGRRKRTCLRIRVMSWDVRQMKRPERSSILSARTLGESHIKLQRHWEFVHHARMRGVTHAEVLEWNGLTVLICDAALAT